MFQLPYLVSGGERFNVVSAAASGTLYSDQAQLSGRGSVSGHAQIGPVGGPIVSRETPFEKLPVIFVRGRLISSAARLQCRVETDWRDYNEQTLLLLAA